MKKISALFILLSILFYGCEEVVEVDLSTQKPRLVIDAGIDWTKGTDGSQQTIRLTTTTAYYDPNVPPVTGATVFVTDANGQVFDFVESIGTGNYICDNFIPEIGLSYTLTVIHQGQTYTAQENLVGVPGITDIVQTNDGGFLGEDIELRYYYQDDPNSENYYLEREDAPVVPYPDFSPSSDEFSNGNLSFGIFSHEDLEAGDVIDIRLYGITKRYFEYMEKLLSVAGGGGPFGTSPATVRGNIVNQAEESNYALGYFRLAEVDRRQVVIE
ncbi:DUF4249 domain-containing protein [Flavobacterium selenitireducens]|uniref:DUF4249 domain-containing protein n=1 Tax=Flavobacterium selenitireducens TaxID=2722704 RepID=UPI00168C0FE0|nr:DUF4249 domain-containing protein [Flavobacterium selenitireducens]MBD3583640.1 DUF4249 domain-containing protein [Flavobacterium selenitireducens]